MEPNTRKVLLVDDDEDDYILTRKMLSESRWGKYTLEWASTFHEGWTMIQAREYDAVLVDYDLGPHTGLELIRLAVAQNHPSPMILYTGRGSYEVDLQAMQAGAALYLTKSEVNPLLLDRGIRYAIERKRAQAQLLQNDEALRRVNEDLKQELSRRQKAETELEEKSRRLQAALERQRLLSEAGAGLLAGADPIERLDDFFQRVSQSLGLEVYVQYNLAPDGSHLDLGRLGGFPHRYYKVLARLELGQAVCGTVAQTRQPMYVNDVQQSQDRKVRLIRSLGISTYACHPLIVDGDLLGTLSFGSRTLSRFDPETIDLLKTFCSMVANALARKRTEEALRRERELLQTLFDRIPVMITMYHPGLEMRQFNARFEQLTGWTTEDARQEGFDLMEKFYPDPAYRRMVADYMLSLQEGWRDFEVTAKDGSIIASSWTNFRLSDDTQVGIGIDIRDRKQAEQALRDGERQQRELAQSLAADRSKLEAVLRNLPVGVWIADPSGRLVDKNPHTDRIWGGDAPMVAGIDQYPDYPAWSPETGKLLSADEHPLAIALRTGRPVGPVELNIRRFDGADGTILASAAPIRDPEGALTGVVRIHMDITERKQIEAERERLLAENRQQRQFLERLIQAVPLAVAVLKGPEHRFTITNPQLDLLLSDRGNLVGRTAAEVWPEGGPVLPLLDRVFQSGQPFSTRDVSLNVLHGGIPEKGDFDITCTPLRDEHGQVEGILALAIDTTAQVAGRKELERQKNLLQAIFDHAPVGIAVVEGPELTYVMANGTYEAIPGKADLPILGHTAAEMFPSVVKTGDLQYLTSVLETGQGVSLPEYALLSSPGGAETWWQVELIPLPDSQGQVNQVLIISLDITTQVLARKALKVEQDRLLAVFDSAPAGIVVADSQARIVTTNEQADRLFKGPAPFAGETGGHPWLRLCDPDGRPYAPRDLPLTRSALDGETFTNLEMAVLRPDGQSLPLLVNCAPVRDAQGAISGAVGVFQDISRLKQAEEDAEHYARRLEQSNQDLQDFAFIASHDLQEPLRKFTFFASRLHQQAGARLSDEENDYLERMSQASGRMQTMLRGLLDYSRVSTRAQAHQPVDLGWVAAEVLQDLEVQLKVSGGQVEVGELPVIDAEPTQMHQLFLNLISNALKFSRPGVPPQVKVTSRRLERPSLGQPHQIEIRVEDNGIGFDPQALDELFLPFHRLVGRSQYEGSGMGLAICRKIVERHAGAITAESQPGKGSAFIVHLPLS